MQYKAQTHESAGGFGVHFIANCKRHLDHWESIELVR